jgi:hypothetical protein
MAAHTESSTSDTLISAPAFTPEMQMANMLGLCEAQMESALQDSDKAVDALIKAFTCMVDATRNLSALTENLPEELKQKMSTDIDGQVAEISKQMGAAVMAFQFYDKLTQRLGHVRYSLSTLALFVCDRTQSNQPEQWKRLLNTLRRLYRTEEERQIFQMIMDGIANDVSPAIALPAVDETKAGEVELF